jgi:hypothetical protein
VVQVAEISVVNGWSFLVPSAPSLLEVFNKCIVSLDARVGEVALSLGPLNRPRSSLEALVELVKVDGRSEVHEGMTVMSSHPDRHVEEIVAKIELIVDDGDHILKGERIRNVLDHDRTTTIMDDELRDNLENGM